MHYYFCDLRSEQQVNAVADKIRVDVGHPTVIINNAGVARGKTILDSEPGDIRFTFDVNVFAHFWVTRAFLPNMIARDHGMVVTVSSVAAWLTVPNMTDYGASKAAVLAFHEGLTAELKTKYDAPRVRTILALPGHTRTALFDGYDQKTNFSMPAQHPESVAEAVVEKVLGGRSGMVVMPRSAGWAAGLRAFPDWYQVRVRRNGHFFMENFRGRQVIEDVDATLEQRPNQFETSESTVLVSQEQEPEQEQDEDEDEEQKE